MAKFFELNVKQSNVDFRDLKSNEILDLKSILNLIQNYKLKNKKIIVYENSVYTIVEVLNLLQETETFKNQNFAEILLKVEEQEVPQKKDDFVQKDLVNDNLTILEQLYKKGMIEKNQLKKQKTLIDEDTQDSTDFIPYKTTISGLFVRNITEDEIISEKITIYNSLGEKLNFIDESINGSFGYLKVSSNKWIYTLEDEIQKLNDGDKLVENFIIELEDGTKQNIEISIIGVNDYPFIENTNLVLVEDSMINGQINYFDVDSSVEILYDGSIEGLQINKDGSYTFNSDAYDFLSKDKSLFLKTTVQIIDEQGATEKSDFNISITGTNDYPTIDIQSSISTIEDKTVSVAFSTSDIDGLIVSTYASALNGKTILNGNELIYIPNDDFNGIDTITLNAKDDSGAITQKEILVDIKAINDKPKTSLIEGYDKFLDESELNDFLGVSNSLLIISHEEILSKSKIIDVDSNNFEITLNPEDITFTKDGMDYSFVNTTMGVKQVDLLFKMMNPDVQAQIGDFLVYNTSFDSLNTGDEVDVKFYINIYDGEDYSEKLPVEFKVIGSNDAPVIDEISVINVNEDEQSQNFKVTGSDIDTDSSFLFSIDESVDGLSFDENGNASFDPTHPTYQYLNEGELKTITIPVSITDENAATNSTYLTINILGTNDEPKIENKLLSVNEGDIVVNGYLAGVDADTSAVLTYTTTSVVAGFVLNSNGTYSLDLNEYRYLSLDEELNLDIPILVTDDNSATNSSTLSVKIIGTNEVPSIKFITELAINEDDSIASGQIISEDIDKDAILTCSTNSLVEGFTLEENGTYTFDASSYQYLVENEILVLTIPVTLSDENNATTSDNITIQITGRNDIPVITSIEQKNLFEDDLILNGQIIGNDADDGAVLTYSTTASLSGFTFNSDGSYSFDPSLSDYQSLSSDDTLTFSIPITLTDDKGTSTTEDFVIKLTGTNDYPILTLDSSISTLEDTTTRVNYSASDIDSNIGIVGSALNGVVIINDNGTIDYTPNSNFNGVDTISVTVTDDKGASVTKTSTINVQPVNDTPIIDTVTSNDIEEESVDLSTIIGKVNVSDNDVNTTLIYTINDANNYVQVDDEGNVTLTQEGIDAINLDTSSPDLEDFTYTVSVSDGIESVTTATQKIDITRVNDEAPIFSTNIGNDITENSLNTSTVVATFSANDNDDGDSLIYAIKTGNELGYFNINSATGDVTLTQDGVDAINSDVGVDLIKLQIVVEVTDGNNHKTDSLLTDINITRVNDNAPIVVVDATSVDEDSTVSVDVLANDSDLDDGNTLTLTSVSSSKGETSIVDNKLVFDTANDFESLGDNQSEDVDVTYTVSDGILTSTSTATISVNGVNDAPTAVDDLKETLDYGVLNNGVTGTDNATGIGYIMYSQENVFDRFSSIYNGNAQHLVSVKFMDAKWYYDTNSKYVEFTPVTTDRLLAQLDFTNDTANELSGISNPSYQIEGINAGYFDGDFKVTPNIWAGASNAGEFAISGAINIGSLTNPLLTAEDTAITIFASDLLSNDIDPDTNDTLNLISVSHPTNGTVSIDLNGDVLFTPTSNFSGNATFEYTISDGNGETSTAAVTVSVTEDGYTLIPTIDLIDSSDTGSSNNDDITSDTTPTFEGTTEPNATVKIYDESNNIIGQSTADSSGNYTITTSALSDGTQTLTVRVSDSSSNEESTTQVITIDTAISLSVSNIQNIREDVNDGGTIDTTAPDINAGTAQQVVATLSSDTDVTYGIDNSKFEVIGNEVRVKDGSIFDYETSTSESIKITVTDKAGNTTDSTFSVNITDYEGSYTSTTTSKITGTSEEDTLSGNDEKNKFKSSLGADSMDGGSNNDALYYDNSDEAVNLNLNTNINTGGTAQGDTIFNIEQYYLSDYNDEIIADDNTDTFYLGDGDDTIYGNGGNDYIYGGEGADYIDGGESSKDRDTSFYTDSLEGVTVNLLTNINTGGTAQGDTLVNIERIQGSNYSDNITGDNENNILYGNDGDDIINAKGGTDTIIGGSGNDTALFDGNKADYTISYDSTKTRYIITNINTSDKTYVSDDVENIVFADGSFTQEDLILEGTNDSDFFMDENTALTITPSEILRNDTDEDISNLTIVSVDNSSNGTVVLNGQDIEFTPATDFYGEATFTYSVSDGNDIDTVTVTVDVNNIPKANEDIPQSEHTIEICSIGNDNPEISSSIRGVKIDGSSVPIVNQRGLTITVLDDDLNIVLNERFDTYSSLDDSNLLATKIEEIKAMDLSLKVIFTTSDEWTKNLNQNAKDALISIGANSEILNSIQMTSNDVTYRSAYALVVDKVEDNYYNSFEEFSYRYGESINHTIEIGSLITTEDKVFYFDIDTLLNNDTDFDNDTISLVSIENPTYNNIQAGTFEIVEINGISKIKFIPNDNLDFLGNNESINIDFSYTIKDSHNSQDSITSSLKINGVNDSVEFLDSSLEYLNFNGSTVYETSEVTQQVRTDELIQVDTSKTYKLSFDVTAGDENGNYNPTNNQYFGIVCYDIDGNEIRYQDSEHYGTGSYLTQDLNIGDTKIYIQDASDWYNGTVSGWSGLKWYGYENSNGITYDDFTYSRNHEVGLWDENSIIQLEDGTYEITLNEPWNNDTLSAGDPVANARLGMIFTYSNLVSDTINSGTSHDESFISDFHKYNGFRHGTEFIKVAGLVNWDDVNEVDSEGDIEGGVISYSNILFEEIALKEDLNTIDNNLTTSGELSFLDTDINDTHLVSYEKNPQTIGDLSLLFDETTKTITYNYTVDNSLVQYLNEREVLDEKFAINVEDVDSNGNRLGTFTSKELIIQVAGTSDKPIVENVYQYQDEVISGLQDIHGNVQLKEDLDTNDSHKFYFETPKVIVDGVDVTAEIQGLNLTINQYNGYYKIVGDFNFLTKGQTADISLDYYVIDSEGLKSDIKTINAEISGVNDVVSINDNITDSIMTYKGNHTVFVDGSTTKTMLNFQTDEYITVDTSKSYNLSATIIAGDENGNYNSTNTQYAGIACYDIDKNFIGHQNTNHYGTGSYLSQDLKQGDTKIYVQDASDWYDGSNSAYRGIAYYGYEDSTGYVYDDFTYTRNVFMKNYDENSIVQLEDGTYEITLNTPWSGENLNSGDAIANATYGGGYNYNLISGKTIPQGENTYSVLMTGIESNDRTEGYNDVVGFRSGTAYIKGLVLANYQDQDEVDSEGDIGGGVIEYSNMQLQLALLENSDKVENGILTLDGNVEFIDLDDVENKISYTKESGTLGELILDLDSQNSQINYRYEIDESLVDYLSQDETKEEKFYIKIEDVDAQGNLLGTYSQKEISILIKGEDDNFVTSIDGRSSTANYIKNEESIFAGATSFNIEMTINSNINETSALLSYSVPSQNNELLIFTTASGVINFYFGGSNKVLGTTNILDGNKHDIRLTWESSTGITKLYIDGVLDTEEIYKQNYTVSSDEGVLVLGQEQDSNGAGFVSSQAFSGEYSDISIIANSELKAQWKMDYISENGFILDQTDNNHDLLINGDVEIIKTTSGSASDGYILGATVFADENENGIFDEGESYDTTNIFGDYELSSSKGTLTLIGGVDISTNSMFNTVMTAPEGSIMITPFTSIIDKMLKLEESLSLDESNNKLLDVLNLDTHIDLLTLDSLDDESDLGLATQKIALMILSMNSFAELFSDENGFELLALEAITNTQFDFTNELWISNVINSNNETIINTIISINEAMLNAQTLEELVQVQIEAGDIYADIKNGIIVDYSSSEINTLSKENSVGLITKEDINEIIEDIEVSITSYKILGNELEFSAGESVSLNEGEFTLFENGEYSFTPISETFVGSLPQITYMTNVGVKESFIPSYLESLFTEVETKNYITETTHTDIISLDLSELISDNSSLDALLNYANNLDDKKDSEDTQIINNSKNYQIVEGDIIENFAKLNENINDLIQIDIDMF